MAASPKKRGPREHPPEMVWKAQELYCVNRMTYREVSKELGVAESTLKRWAVKYDWREKRDRLAQAECDIRADLVLARSGMIKSLMETHDAQKGFAVASLETLAMRQAEAERNGKAMRAAQRAMNAPDNSSGVEAFPSITSAADAVVALRLAVERKIQLLLASPDDVDFKALADVQKALKLLTEMEAEHRRAQDVEEANSKPKGLSADLADRIRELL